MTNNKQKTIIAIELTNYCNIRCSHCPQGHLDVPVGYMDRETLAQCLAYCDGYTEFNWRGEPTLHPNLVEYVRIAKEFNKKLNLGFHTNGILLTERLFKDLAHTGLDWMHVSLHTLESCSKYKQIAEWNKKSGSPLGVYAEVDNTQEELMARSCGFTSDMFCRDTTANWGGYLTDHRIVNADAEKHAQNCMFINEYKFIAAWDGTINACCWDYQLLHALGNVKDFKDIRHSRFYKLCSSCIWIR